MVRSVLAAALAVAALIVGVGSAAAGAAGSAPFALTWDVPASCEQLGGVQTVDFDGTLRWNVDGQGRSTSR